MFRRFRGASPTSGEPKYWDSWSLLGAEGPPGRGVGEGKLAKKLADDLNTPMDRRPGEISGFRDC